MRNPPNFISRGAVRLAVLLVALVVGARAARAGEADAPEQGPTSWYGWQTMMADGAAIGLFALSFATRDQGTVTALSAASFTTYVLGGPVVHWAHGHGRKGIGSLVTRVGLPVGGLIAGAIAGAAVCRPSSSNVNRSDDDTEIGCPVVWGALGFLGGMVAAPIVDASVIAREPVTPSEEPPLQAAFVPSGGGGTFVLAGRF